MRRRPRIGSVAVPSYLAVYDPADWPDDCHTSCVFWRALEAFLDGLTDEQREDLPLFALALPDVAWHPELI